MSTLGAVESFCDHGGEISYLKKAGNFSTVYSYFLLKKYAPCRYVVSFFVCFEAYIIEGYVTMLRKYVRRCLLYMYVCVYILCMCVCMYVCPELVIYNARNEQCEVHACFTLSQITAKK